MGIFQQIVAVDHRRRRAGPIRQAVEQLPLLDEGDFFQDEIGPVPEHRGGDLGRVADQEAVFETG